MGSCRCTRRADILYFYSLLFNSVWAYFKEALRERATREAATADDPPSADGTGFEYAVATTVAHSEYEIALAVALVGRMQRFCEEHGIRLTVVDVPQRAGTYRFAPSMPPAMVEQLSAAQVEYVSSRAVLGDIDGAVEIHVRHGHHHISEFTHAVIGVELGRKILQELQHQRASVDSRFER